jgi:hypothetical protein
MAEDKKPEQKKSLAQQMNDINFKNESISKIRQLQDENTKLKDKMGRSAGTKRVSSATRISGLQTLKNTLGKQFSKGDLSDLLS